MLIWHRLMIFASRWLKLLQSMKFFHNFWSKNLLNNLRRMVLSSFFLRLSRNKILFKRKNKSHSRILLLKTKMKKNKIIIWNVLDKRLIKQRNFSTAFYFSIIMRIKNRNKFFVILWKPWDYLKTNKIYWLSWTKIKIKNK